MIPQNRSILIGLLVLAVAAGALRFYALDFGLPARNARPDEGYLVGLALGVGQGNINPKFFDYPSLNIYLTFLVYAVWFILGALTGQWHTPEAFALGILEDPTGAFLLARAVQAAFGVGTVLVVALLGARLYGWRAGFAAGVVMAVAFLPVRNSHFAKVDSAAAFWSMAAFLPLVDVQRAGRMRDYALAGAAMGLALGSKYTTVMLVPALLLVHGMARRAEGASWRAVLLDRRVVYALAVAFAVFALTSPFVFLDFASFRESWARASGWVRVGTEGQTFFPASLLHHLRVSLRYGLGLLPALLGLAGMGWWVWRRKPLEWAMALFAVLTWFSLAWDSRGPARYMLPVVPVCAVAGAALLDAGLVRLPRLKRWAASPNLMMAVGLGLILWETAGASLGFLALAGRPDTRAQAAAWLDAHAPDGAAVLLYAENQAQDILMPPVSESLETMQTYLDWPETPGALRTERALLAAHADELRRPRFDVHLPDTRQERPPALRIPSGDLCALQERVDYVVLADYYGFLWLPGEDFRLEPALEAQLAGRELAAEFVPLTEGIDPSAVDVVWDDPGLLAPLTGFELFAYMGPRIRIVAPDRWACR